MAALLLAVLIGFCGLAIDIGPIYNRKVDLRVMAEAAALAAARELNGTAAGIAAAKASARSTAERLTYQNGTQFSWNDAALSFGTTPERSGAWIPAAAASGAPDALFYAKVDTALLDPAIGAVRPLFMPVLSSRLETLYTSDSAVAGRSTVNVTPIAVCAMSADPAAQRINAGLADAELVEHGFRRGVSYDLMQLNPDGENPARYLINPVAAPGSSSTSFNTSTIGQFVCTGTMWVPRLTGGAMRVSPLPGSAPLASLSAQLNSRFDVFAGGWCSPNGAPPDYNVKQYAYDKGVAWMNPATGNLSAAMTKERGRLETIADLPAAPSGTMAGAYGPLWANAKAAKYAASEPNGGYATFATSDWAKLYKYGPTASAYPTASASPYLASSGTNYAAPAAARLEISAERRRVLYVPLLACPVPPGANVQATVLAVGKFFMTVPASNDSLIGEFGGLAGPDALTGLVELYP